MEWIWYPLGAALILIGLSDVFHTLFHPSGRGRLSRHMVGITWRVAKAIGGGARNMAGPVAVVISIISWTLIQAVGWALVYLPSVPSGFLYSPGLPTHDYPDFAEALYISFVGLATLGFGDVVAVEPWLRLLTPLEALTGFILLTAAVSWLMQLYSALARRRSLALHLANIARAESDGSLGAEGGSTAVALRGIAAELARVRVDLGQNAETYHFRETDHATCLPLAMHRAARLRDRAARSSEPELRAAADLLSEALADLADFVSRQFLRSAEGGERDVIDAAIADHACPRDAGQ